MHYDLVVVGGGAGGMSTCISAYKNGVKNILLIEKEPTLGGILNQCIHQGFGLHYFKEEMSGPNYAQKLIDEIKTIEDVTISLNSFVLDINLEKELLYTSENGKQWVTFDAVCFATGSYERHASQINLPGQRLNGIYPAGVAQKYLNTQGLNIGKKVFILGSGDIGLIMARRMTLEGCEVVGVAEIMPYSNGLNRNIVTCLEDFDIPLYLSHTVSNVYGDNGNLQKIEISQVDDTLKVIEGTSKEFEVDTLLLAVGLVPLTELMNKLNLAIDTRTKSVIVSSTYQTSVDWAFVCGNALHVHDLVDYVSKEATIVGEYISKYLDDNIDENKKEVKVTCDSNIGYVIPQSIDINNKDEKIELFFRCRKPFKKSRVLIYADNELIRSVNKHILLPAEMESIVIKTDKLNEKSQEIKVVIEEDNEF